MLSGTRSAPSTGPPLVSIIRRPHTIAPTTATISRIAKSGFDTI